MMRAFLLLGVVGIAIYGFLVVTGNALSDGTVKSEKAVQATSPQSGTRLSSWGSYLYLPSGSTSQEPQAVADQEPVSSPSQETRAPSTSGDGRKVAAALAENGGAKEVASGVGSDRIAADSATEPSVTKGPLRKSNRRNQAARQRAMVSAADPWNDRWSRRVERRRGFGLFMFRPVPRFVGR